MNNLKARGFHDSALGTLTCVTGVLVRASPLVRQRNPVQKAGSGAERREDSCRRARRIHRHREFDKVIDIDQSPIGRTPRSNPATYTGCSTTSANCSPRRRMPRRAATARAVSRSMSRAAAARRSAGDGLLKIEMHFLPDVYVPCDACKGRYNKETPEVRYKGKNIYEALDMTVDEACGSSSPTCPRSHAD